MKRITEARATPNYRLFVKFDDGASGEVDLSDLVGKGVFTAWQDPSVFAEVTIDGKKNSFKTYIRLRVDSAIWISVTPLFGIEVGRFIITPDTVKLINRISSNYFVGNFDYLNKRFDSDVNFKTVQAMILGNSIGLEEVEKPKSSVDHGRYLLSSFKKGKLKKAMQKTGKISEMVYSHWLDPETYKITKLSIYDYVLQRSMVATFNDIKKTESGQLFPHETRLSIKADQNIEINLDYSKISLDKPLKFPFKIPEKFERIPSKYGKR